jgi:tRNA(Ile)-lysidine synthase
LGFCLGGHVYDLVDSQSGKQVFRLFRLLKDRDFLILLPINTEIEVQDYFIDKTTKEVTVPLNLSFCKVKNISVTSNTIFVDQNKLRFPLVLRHWRKADYFQPFGMGGKSKKVSKLLKMKISLIEKENVWILWSGETVVWVLGIRQDDRFRVSDTTQNILKIQLE